MRFAPPAALRLADHGGGLNQTSVRAYNERLVISLLRRHESMARQTMTQISGLSAQTVSVITSALERDHLLTAGELVRGKVGPPSRLLSLNPKGAYAIGIKFGIKSAEMVLMDFVGSVLEHFERQYDFPERHALITWTEARLVDLINVLPPAHRPRMVGIGVSLPTNFDRWPLQHWPVADPASWHEVNLEERLEEVSGLSVYIQNDVTAAAGAELAFGAARELGDFAYFFVGATTSSRLILNHHIHAGREPAGCIASLSDLEQALRVESKSPLLIWERPEDWQLDHKLLDPWIGECAAGVVARTKLLSEFVDLNTIIIDGRFPSSVKQALCDKVLKLQDSVTGPTKIFPGKVGAFAKSVGAASLPFYARFMVDDVGLAERQ